MPEQAAQSSITLDLGMAEAGDEEPFTFSMCPVMRLRAMAGHWP